MIGASFFIGAGDGHAKALLAVSSSTEDGEVLTAASFPVRSIGSGVSVGMNVGRWSAAA